MADSDSDPCIWSSSFFSRSQTCLRRRTDLVIERKNGKLFLQGIIHHMIMHVNAKVLPRKKELKLSGKESNFPKVTDEPSVENLLILTAVVLSSFSLALSPSIETSVLSEMNVSDEVNQGFNFI